MFQDRISIFTYFLQTMRLLHMICHPESQIPFAASSDTKQAVARVVHSLDQWSLRAASVEIKLMLKHCGTHSSDIRRWSETVAPAFVDVFHRNPLYVRETTSNSPSIEKKRGNRSSTKEQRPEDREIRPSTPPLDANAHQMRLAKTNESYHISFELHSSLFLSFLKSRRKKDLTKMDPQTVWLIPSLVERAPHQLQHQILKQCG